MASRPVLSRTLARTVGRLRAPAAVASVDQVRLIRYVGPGRAFRRSYGLVAVVRAPAGGAWIEGLGESTMPARQVEAVWRISQAMASRLVGSAIPRRRDAPRSLEGIEGWALPGEADPAPRRVARLAIEAALLDVMRKLQPELPIEGPAGGPTAAPQRQPSHRVPRTRPGSTSDMLTSALRDDPGTAWGVKLLLTGDDDHDVGWLSHAIRLEEEAGRERPVWLVGGKRTLAAAGDFVQRVAEQVGDLLGQRRLLLEEPMRTRKIAGAGSDASDHDPSLALPRLQRLVDDVLPAQLGRGRRALVVAGASVRHSQQLSAILNDGGVGGFHLLPAAWGTLIGLRSAARAVKNADKSTLVILGGGPGSRLSLNHIELLAASCPQIDVVSITAVAAWPSLLAGSGDTGELTGSAGALDWDELAAVVDEVVTLPKVEPAASTEPPNNYPGHPLLKADLPARSLLLETEALRLGLRTRRFSPGLVLADDPATGTVLGFSDSESNGTSFAAAKIALHKGATRTLLADRGLPIADGSYHPPNEVARAQAAGLALGFPLVVKPAGGSKGTAVTTGIGSADELAGALGEVMTSPFAGTGIIVERCITGNDHRILVARDEVISVIRRAPASVLGDGQHTIEQLIVLTNAARRQVPHIAKRLIPLDQRVDDFLRRNGMSRHTIPASGKRIQVRAEANVHQGGNSHEVLDSTHPTVLTLALDAIRAVPGLMQAGIDILLEDHRLPVDEQQVAIIEINSRPVQTLHHFPMFGSPRNASATLVRKAARAAGLSLGEADENVATPTATKLDVHGFVQRVGYRKWMATVAEELDLSGWVANTSDPSRVTALIQGSPEAVGLLVRLAFEGPAGADVVETCAQRVSAVPLDGFIIRHDSGNAADTAG